MDKKAAIVICFNAWNDLSTDTTIDFLKDIFEKTNYDNYEVILYENNSKPELLKKVFNYINSISTRKIVLISPVNKVWYNMNREYNDATKITDAEIFVFANNDMKIINEDWLKNAVKWLYSDSSIGMACPHTNITYGNFFGCEKCPLVETEKEGKYYSCLFTKGCTKRFQDNSQVLWNREWPSMGIYICTRETLEKVGMHDTDVDFFGQDMSTMLKFENAGFKVVVAMDSLVEHYGEGHLTLDYIARDGSNDYNFRAIHAYKNISEYLKQNSRMSALHVSSRIEWDKWYENNYINPNPPFSREEYNKWVELHKDEWSNEVKYAHATVAIICTLQNSILTELAINAIESVINSIKDTNKDDSELIIYENNSEPFERVKLFEYLSKKKLNSDIPIKWISVSYEKFNINKVYNRIARFTRNEILCFANQDIEVINKEWLRNAMNWLLFSEYRNKIGVLLTSAHESVPARHDNIRTVPEHILNKCGDTPMPIFFIKRSVLNSIGGFNENFPFAYADKSLYEQISLTNFNLYGARDVLIKHYEGHPVSDPKGKRVDMVRDLEIR
jgi:GT2 family glycosyltransferase